MKQTLLFSFISLFISENLPGQGIVFQDTVFTAPVSISDEAEFVTFQNCRFVGIVGDALTLNNTGAVISNCTFENIAGAGIVLDSSEVYLVNDTLRNIVGYGVYGEYSTLVVQGSKFSKIKRFTLTCFECELVEVSDCIIVDVGYGIYSVGSSDDQLSISHTIISQVKGPNGQPGTGTAINAIGLSLVEIENCTVDSCTGYGIRVDAIGSIDPSTETVVIQGNTISRTNFHGIHGTDAPKAVVRGNEVSYPGFLGGFPDLNADCIAWLSNDVIIEDNHLHHALAINGEQGSGVTVYSSATIVRNHIHDCAGSGIRYYNLAIAGEKPLLMFNNVIHDVGTNPIYYDGSASPNMLTEPIQTVIRNNTLHATPHNDPILEAPVAVSSNESPVVVQGNILIFEGVADTSVYVQTLSGATIIDNLNLKVSGDLNFKNYVGRDFHLVSVNSPAYNFLPLNFGLPNDDFDGTPRIGLHDAGAYELASTDTICGCTNCPLGIPDLFFGDYFYSVRDIANNNLASPAQGVCGVRVQFQHEYLGDIKMQLISPGGQSIQLVGPTGFFGATDNTNWDVGFTTCNGMAIPDPGADPVWSNDHSWGTGANYTGIYYPANGCLEEFNTGSITGDWTLRVFDTQVSDTGAVYKFEMLFCDMTGISCQPCSNPPQAFFTTTVIGGWSVGVQNQTSGSTQEFQISFGDGFTGSGHIIPTFHTYADTGAFLIRLVALNECGADTFTQSVYIQGALPVAFVSAQPNTGCAPLEVQLGATQAINVEQWHWIIPGGSPEESFEIAPVVTYASPGNYLITVIVSNIVASDTLKDVLSVNVLPGLVNPSFSTQLIGDSIICVNTTQNSTSFFWTLNNDNPIGINTSPQVFEVDSSGNYTVALTVSNTCETVTVLNTVTVILSGAKNLEAEGWQFAISPNPNIGEFNLTLVSPENATARLSIFNSLGEEIHFENIQIIEGSNNYPFLLSGLPSGMYHLHFQTAESTAVLKFVVR